MSINIVKISVLLQVLLLASTTAMATKRPLDNEQDPNTAPSARLKASNDEGHVAAKLDREVGLLEALPIAREVAHAELNAYGKPYGTFHLAAAPRDVIWQNIALPYLTLEDLRSFALSCKGATNLVPQRIQRLQAIENILRNKINSLGLTEDHFTPSEISLAIRFKMKLIAIDFNAMADRDIKAAAWSKIFPQLDHAIVVAGNSSLHGKSLSSFYCFRAPTLTRLAAVTHISLKKHGLKSVPNCLTQIANLISLDLSNNHLTELPEAIGQLSKLEELDLGGNQLTELPESLGKLRNMKKLSAANNLLKSVPESMDNLTQMLHLSLQGNQITMLPESLGNLKKIWWIELENNQIQALPKSFRQLYELKILQLDGNPIPILDSCFRRLDLNLYGFTGEFAEAE